MAAARRRFAPRSWIAQIRACRSYVAAGEDGANILIVGSWPSRLNVLGLALSLISLLLLVSLATYREYDQSLNTASTAAPHNFLGYAGAIVGDLLIQGTGMVSMFISGLLFVASLMLAVTYREARIFPVIIVGGAASAMLSASALLGCSLLAGDGSTGLSSGGLIGYLITLCLVPLIGRTGIVVAALTLALGACLTFRAIVTRSFHTISR